MLMLTSGKFGLLHKRPQGGQDAFDLDTVGGLPGEFVKSALDVSRHNGKLYAAPFVGNIAMGIVFGWWYTRSKRVMPLVVAHTILDVVAFVGYALLRDRLSWL